MSTILEGLNKLSGALGGAETATENLEALNAIAGALGGETTSTNNADAIDMIAEHASGGGGSSDFSTATVTIVNNSGETVTNVNATLAFEENALGEGSPATSFPSTIMPVESGETSTIQVILYKGNGVIDPINNSSLFDISFSGNIEDVGQILLVSGDGTITFSNKS